MRTKAQNPFMQIAIEEALEGISKGQGGPFGSVVVKDGTILAVEGFEGTDETIRRAGRLGGPGGVVVKVAKRGHDMRFDIPIIGTRTFKNLKKAGISCLAVEAKRSILLDREELEKLAKKMGLAFLAIDAEAEAAAGEGEKIQRI